MKVIDDEVIQSVVDTLQKARLFRYDCEKPDDSPTARLESRFAEIMGSKYCIALNSCSSGLFLSLICTGVVPGDEVLIPAFTFIAVPGAVVHAHAKPVLVEMTEDYVIDPDDLERKITPNTKHLMLSYMRGRVPDMDRIVEICERRGITLLEDAAHSLGVLWDGRSTGRFGKAAAFSAQSYKLLDGGEGGLMITDDKEIAFKAMLHAGCYERNWQKHFGTAEDAAWIDGMVNALPAYNFRMSNLSAAVLLPQIERIDDRVAHYNANYERLAALLSQNPAIRLPKFLPKVRPAADSIQFELVGLPVDAMARFVAECKSRGLDIAVFGVGGKNARCYWNWTFFEPNDCPKTKALLMRTADLRLPLRYTADDMDRIGGVIAEAITASQS